METAILRSPPNAPDPGWWNSHSSAWPLPEPATQGEVENPITGKSRWLVQRNVCASSQPRYHEVVWTDEEGEDDESQPGRGGGRDFVRSLLVGDRVAVFARALVRFFDNNFAFILIMSIPSFPDG